MNAADIDALLPQTQCTRCGFAGCRPYAEAIVRGEAEINQCPPGGAATIARLAAALGRKVLALNPANGIEGPPLVAQIDEALCIGCQLCHIACWDGAHQCIHMDRAERPDAKRITVTPIPKLDGPMADKYKTPLYRIPRVDEIECVGCNLCALVCPVEGCITMERVENGLPFQSWDMRLSGALPGSL